MNWSSASFWTHGVNTIAEFPDRTINVRRTGYGTIVQQVKGEAEVKNNWFHIPLHTVNIMDERTSYIDLVKFRLGLNEYARLGEVHVRYGHELIFNKDVDMEGPDINQAIDLSEKELGGTGPEKLQNGLVLCLRIEFIDDIEPGEVIFYGAGIRYVESDEKRKI